MQKSNPQLENLIQELRVLSNKENVKLWKRVAEDLRKSTRRQSNVNLWKLSKNVKENETALVAGKVLSEGELSKKMTIAALNFSQKAKEKISKNGKAITIKELIKENPKGAKVRIIK